MHGAALIATSLTNWRSRSVSTTYSDCSSRSFRRRMESSRLIRVWRPFHRGRSRTGESFVFESNRNSGCPAPIFRRWRFFRGGWGGRIALVCEVAIGSHRLAAWNLHLESRGSDVLRIEQLKETLADTQRYKDKVPSVIGGDFNLVASEGIAAEVLGEAGFHDAVGSRSPTTRGASPRRIDGLFVRGGTAEGGAVHTSVAGSDHFPVSTRIRSRVAHEWHTGPRY
jgi:hypothetical protein